MKPKITIRPWNSADAPALVRLADNINVWNNVRDYFPHPYTETDAQQYLTATILKYESGPAYEFAVLADGEVAGGIGCIPGTDVHRLSAEVGYWLGEPHWGRGIMPRAVSLFVEHIYRNTAFIHLWASIFGFNTASCRVLEKAGFTKTGQLHDCVIKNGKITGLVYYELTKATWENSVCHGTAEE